jgi:hypothetical protein
VTGTEIATPCPGEAVPGFRVTAPIVNAEDTLIVAAPLFHR